MEAPPLGPRTGQSPRAVRQIVAALARSGLPVLGLLLLGPLGLTLALRVSPGLDPTFESATFHVVVVSAIAGCALLVALFTSVAAARARRPAPVLLAMGCLFVGLPMLAHGLTTPGIWGRPLNLWVARLPVLAMAGLAACMLAATARERAMIKRLVGRFPRSTLGLVTLALAGAGTVIVLDPTVASGSQPIPGEIAVSHVLMIPSGLALLVTGSIRWRRWRLGRDRVELALVIACWLSVDAVAAFELGRLWRLSWWDYHGYLLAGFAAAAWAVLAGYRSTRSFEATISTISVTDPLEHITRGYPEALTALVGAVEVKDPYTHGHSLRVADLSARIGLRMGLDPDRLRRLTQGAHLHDIGKIGIPDRVLNKPDSLTEDEWELIRAHPEVGWELTSRAPSLRGALDVVRHHHERWDGSGYPAGVAGQDIPIGARIAAVADVWDALTSDRAYRPAWPQDRALEHILGARETLFDPICVDAFLDLMEDRGMTPDRPKVDPAAVAEDGNCHQLDRSGRAVRGRLAR